MSAPQGWVVVAIGPKQPPCHSLRETIKFASPLRRSSTGPRSAVKRPALVYLRESRARQVQRRGLQNERPGLVRGQAHQPCRDVHLLLQIGRERLSRRNRLRHGRGFLANSDRR
jgi:hypothetical protein